MVRCLSILQMRLIPRGEGHLGFAIVRYKTGRHI